MNPPRLSQDSLSWALRHIEKFGDTDIFPVPFEFEAIRHRWNDRGPDPSKPQETLCEYLAKQDLFTWAARPTRKCLSPKHRHGFRVSTQLDPLDTIIFTALVYEIGCDVEKSRLPPEDEIVHSYRFKPDTDGRLYDQSYGFESFRKRSEEIAAGGECQFVVVADIADFYPQIYAHPLENALQSCTSDSGHAKAIGKLLNQWNFRVSYGIPVGPAASRLLAELVIADVDSALMSEGHAFCRFVDDYRIFCGDERRAYQALAFLANTLFENHGLTLQQHKTSILTAEEFSRQNRPSTRDKEKDSLTEKFEAILSHLGIERYEPIDYDELDDATKAEIDSLNLVGILQEQLEGEGELDTFIARFVLRRLAQIDDPSAIDLVLQNVMPLYPVLKDVLEYVTAIRRLSETDRHAIGEALLRLIDDSAVGHLEYHRCLILNTFTHDREWNNESRLNSLYNGYSDGFSRRELILALGRAAQQFWFKSTKRNFLQFAPWERRAFLAAASCLPGDEGKYWYQSVAPQLDELERAVVAWARANPFV